jgi:hypothetical protein
MCFFCPGINLFCAKKSFRFFFFLIFLSVWKIQKKKKEKKETSRINLIFLKPCRSYYTPVNLQLHLA